MYRFKLLATGIGLAAGTLLMMAPRLTGTPDEKARPAPEFPSLEQGSWAGDPTSMQSLRGRVVLLNVWTFG